MTDTIARSVLLLSPHRPLVTLIESWLAGCLQCSFTLHVSHTIADACEYLPGHQVDLILLDITVQAPSAKDPLPLLRAASPASALLALTPQPDESLILDLLCRGAHETLSLATASQAESVRTIARALARVGTRLSTLSPSNAVPADSTGRPRLIHDLNNLLTSINGFTDLLLSQLAADTAARMSAEQIRAAGRRAATLLKSQSSDTAPSSPPDPPAPPSVTTHTA